MRVHSLLFASLLLVATADAKELKAYQDGNLLRMDSVQCSKVETENGHALLCQEYVLQTEQVVYRIRLKNDRDFAPLPIGENAKFRLQKNRMLLRMEGPDSREREYVILSIQPRGDSTAEAGPARVNHLQ
ncbi:MAG: hypothetical protein ABSF15_15565 [Candidatus Sulfotelmatobacter sp.]|jgi:hypothetical protein